MRMNEIRWRLLSTNENSHAYRVVAVCRKKSLFFWKISSDGWAIVGDGGADAFLFSTSSDSPGSLRMRAAIFIEVKSNARKSTSVAVYDLFLHHSSVYDSMFVIMFSVMFMSCSTIFLPSHLQRCSHTHQRITLCCQRKTTQNNKTKWNRQQMDWLNEQTRKMGKDAQNFLIVSNLLWHYKVQTDRQTKQKQHQSNYIAKCSYDIRYRYATAWVFTRRCQVAGVRVLPNIDDNGV